MHKQTLKVLNVAVSTLSPYSSTLYWISPDTVFSPPPCHTSLNRTECTLHTVHRHLRRQESRKKINVDVVDVVISNIHLSCTLQRQSAENLKQIFPEKEHRGHSPNFHIHVSVSDLYVSTMGLPFLLEEICGPILGIYKSLTDTWMWKLGLRPRNSQKRYI